MATKVGTMMIFGKNMAIDEDPFSGLTYLSFIFLNVPIQLPWKLPGSQRTPKSFLGSGDSLDFRGSSL